MPTYVADTHSLIWYFTGSKRLGLAAREAFSEINSGEATLLVPVIVLAELILAIENARDQVDFDAMLGTLQVLPGVKILDFSLDRAISLRSLTAIPEIHDRMIVSEAIAHSATLITRDEVITQSSLVPIVW